MINNLEFKMAQHIQTHIYDTIYWITPKNALAVGIQLLWERLKQQRPTGKITGAIRLDVQVNAAHLYGLNTHID